MLWNNHSGLSGRHAILSPSYGHWLNYDDHKLAARLDSVMSAARGTDLHNLAHESIRLGVYLERPTPQEVEAGKGNPFALAEYVADGIDMGMRCEVPLFYSDNCFGHADTLDFDEEEMFLRIHDLKNGITPSKFVQTEIYDALFCLEYEVDPYTIQREHRIYQREEVKVHFPPPERIDGIMNSIVHMDEQVNRLKGEGYGRRRNS